MSEEIKCFSKAQASFLNRFWRYQGNNIKNVNIQSLKARFASKLCWPLWGRRTYLCKLLFFCYEIKTPLYRVSILHGLAVNMASLVTRLWYQSWDLIPDFSTKIGAWPWTWFSDWVAFSKTFVPCILTEQIINFCKRKVRCNHLKTSFISSSFWLLWWSQK